MTWKVARDAGDLFWDAETTVAAVYDLNALLNPWSAS
jgi:hypothetical protein